MLKTSTILVLTQGISTQNRYLPRFHPRGREFRCLITLLIRMKKLLAIFLACFLFSGVLMATELQSVTPEQLLQMQQHQNALVVDVRTEAEWQASGIIANSHKLQSFDNQGKFDPEKWLAALQQMKSSPDQPVILVCRSGNRSGKVGTFLTEQLGMKNVYHLENGLQSWVKSGHPVSPNCMQVACK